MDLAKKDNMSEKFKPFPQIARLPEEPLLEGPPTKPHQSELLLKEENLPFLEQIGNDLEKFLPLAKSSRQREMQSQVFNKYLTDAENFEAYFDTLNILSEKWQGREKEIAEYKTFFENNLDRYVTNETKYNPKILAKWLHTLTKSKLYKNQAETVLTGFHNKNENSLKKIVDFYYDFAQAILESTDTEVLSQGMKMVFWQTEVFSPNSLGVKNYLLTFHQGNDAILQKYGEIDTAMGFLARTYQPELLSKKEILEKKLLGDEKNSSLWKQNFERLDQKRKLQILQFLDVLAQKNISILPEQKEQWPYNLIFKNPGPLRQLINEQASLEYKNHLYISLPGHPSLILESKPPHAASDFIKKVLFSKPETEEIFSNRTYLSAIYHLSPDPPLDESQKEELSKNNSLLRKEIIEQKRHLVSPRGDKMIIVDPPLTKLGFKSLLFEHDTPKTKTKLTIEVGNYKFIACLDEDLNVVEYQTGKPLLVKLKDRAFLEQIIFAHLRELQCSERIEQGVIIPKTEEEKLLRQKEFTDRRAHLRQLPPGKGFREEQHKLALEESGIDLVRYNLERGKTKETGQITYVKAAEKIGVGGKNPIISRAPKAMDRYKEIVQK